MLNDVITTKEAAKLLRMHEVTVRIMAQKGEIPAVLLGNHYRFRVSELERWLTQEQEKQRKERAERAQEIMMKQAVVR